MQAERLRTAEGEQIQGPLLITPRLFADERGHFYESWNQYTFASALEADGQAPLPFVQDNHSRSCRSVLRGLHYQLPPHPQAKLVRCVVGSILDVAVDLRCSSPTFGQCVTAELSAEAHNQLWIPVGFAHGFITLSQRAEVLYKTTDFWSRDFERSLRWDDPQLAIPWPLELSSASDGSLIQPLLSEKDAAAPLLAGAITAGDVFE